MMENRVLLMSKEDCFRNSQANLFFKFFCSAWTTIRDPTYGNCFTFNSDGQQPNARQGTPLLVFS